MKWISVKNKLPEHTQEVLIFGKYVSSKFRVMTSRFIVINGTKIFKAMNGDFWQDSSADADHEWMINGRGLTHWMPLPEPPN